ncbi:MAG: hypothetical protein FWF50_01810 [Defluviitaleaceae bacterium]|nr:hypothetical protein [Defluviitaleaceae bacterium]
MEWLHNTIASALSTATIAYIIAKTRKAWLEGDKLKQETKKTRKKK